MSSFWLVYIYLECWSQRKLLETDLDRISALNLLLLLIFGWGFNLRYGKNGTAVNHIICCGVWFLKSYDKEMNMAAKVGCDEKTWTKWIWCILREINVFKHEVVSGAWIRLGIELLLVRLILAHCYGFITDQTFKQVSWRHTTKNCHGCWRHRLQNPGTSNEWIQQGVVLAQAPQDWY